MAFGDKVAARVSAPPLPPPPALPWSLFWQGVTPPIAPQKQPEFAKTNPVVTNWFQIWGSALV